MSPTVWFRKVFLFICSYIVGAYLIGLIPIEPQLVPWRVPQREYVATFFIAIMLAMIAWLASLFGSGTSRNYERYQFALSAMRYKVYPLLGFLVATGIVTGRNLFSFIIFQLSAALLSTFFAAMFYKTVTTATVEAKMQVAPPVVKLLRTARNAIYALLAVGGINVIAGLLSSLITHGEPVFRLPKFFTNDFRDPTNMVLWSSVAYILITTKVDIEVGIERYLELLKPHAVIIAGGTFFLILSIYVLQFHCYGTVVNPIVAVLNTVLMVEICGRAGVLIGESRLVGVGETS